MRRVWISVAVFVLSMLNSSPAMAQGKIIMLPVPFLDGLSADGKIAVGLNSLSGEAWRWTEEEGAQRIHAMGSLLPPSCPGSSFPVTDEQLSAVSTMPSTIWAQAYGRAARTGATTSAVLVGRPRMVSLPRHMEYPVMDRSSLAPPKPRTGNVTRSGGMQKTEWWTSG